MDEGATQDTGRILGRCISGAEQRIAQYKKLVRDAYINKDTDLVRTFKDLQHDEEHYVKLLRREKTYWNAGVWEWYFLEKGEL